MALFYQFDVFLGDHFQIKISSNDNINLFRKGNIEIIL